MANYPPELQRAQDRIDECKKQLAEVRRLNDGYEDDAIQLAERLVSNDLPSILTDIRAAYAKGFQDEAQLLESLLWKRHADVAYEVLIFVNHEHPLGIQWSRRGEEWLRESLRLYPTMQARLELGLLYWRLERYDEALQELQIPAQSNDLNVRNDARKMIQEVQADRSSGKSQTPITSSKGQSGCALVFVMVSAAGFFGLYSLFSH